jgi:hypothetical protein
MTPPINIDGNQVSEVTIDGQPVSQVTIDGQEVLRAIPDSVVSRPTDDSTFNGSAGNEIGLRITTDVEFPSIGAELSTNTIDPSTANIYRVSDGTLKGTTDISGLTAGDTFVVNGVDLQPHDGTLATTYNFVITNQSTNLKFGFFSSASYPFTSSDGNLTITKQADGPTGTFSSGNVSCFSRVGDVGF